jgi:hypothetical protein
VKMINILKSKNTNFFKMEKEYLLSGQHDLGTWFWKPR